MGHYSLPFPFDRRLPGPGLYLPRSSWPRHLRHPCHLHFLWPLGPAVPLLAAGPGPHPCRGRRLAPG
eukprot:11277531-Heterocapsa_arctica.AAC.1